MPERRIEAKGQVDFDDVDVTIDQEDLLLVYKAGLLFLEMCHDVYRQRGNYHTFGANRLHNKYLLTSNCNSEKFYAGGSNVRDLLSEIADEYSWSETSIEEALARAVKAAKAPLSMKR